MYGMDMRQYIRERLDSLKSVKEKDMLRDILEEIFIPLYNHTEAQYDRLEARIKNEMPLITDSYVIWNTLMPRGSANGGCPYMFPMLDEDLQLPEIEMDGLIDRLNNEGAIRLDSVFVEADYLVCREMENNSREIFNGVLKTDGDEFKIGIRLKLSKRYSRCIENLYKLFVANGIPWQTVNSPYIFKMFDVMLVRINPNVKNKSTYCGYTASFGNYDKHIRKEVVPVWNVSKLTLKSEDFPLAALDKVNYEYAFDLSEQGAEHGYLADYRNTDIAAVRREENTLIVTSPAKKGLNWEIYKIAKRKDYATDSFQYDLMNNAQDDNFATRMIAHYGTVIKSNAELHRLLASYDVSEYIVLDSVQVVQNMVGGQTYEVNHFIKDEIRDHSVSKSLLMKFKPVKRNSYILRDLMSFLVSQTQAIYPEFNCVGALLI
jgi:hypothetical protein